MRLTSWKYQLLLAGLVVTAGCGVGLLWMLYRTSVPERAQLAEIERRYRDQIDILTDYATSFEQYSSGPKELPEGTSELFTRGAILQAGVNESDKGGRGIVFDGTDQVWRTWYGFSPEVRKGTAGLRYGTATLANREKVAAMRYSNRVVDETGKVREIWLLVRDTKR